MESLEEILRRIATSSSHDTLNVSENAETAEEYHCEICDDARWLAIDAPVGSPEFGQVVPCECQESAWGTSTERRLREYSNLGPLSRMTFDRTDAQGRAGLAETSSFRKAFHAAQTYASSPMGWLVISGPSGTGKTHLAASIVNHCISKGQPARFEQISELIDAIRAETFHPEDEETPEHLFEQVLNAPLLVLDDLGAQGHTAWSDEKLDQLLTHRYGARLPTVITTSLGVEQLPERIRARVTDPYLATLVEVRGGAGNPDRSAVGIESAMLDSMTFESFDDRGAPRATRTQAALLTEARRAAQLFAEHPQGWLYLAGPTGTGKTHLAVAIANVQVKLGRPVMFRFVPELMDDLRRSFQPDAVGRFETAFDHLKNVEVLILDDFGAQASTPWAEEKLYQLIVHRHNAQLPTVITSRVLLDGPEQGRFTSRYSDAIASRLRDGLVVVERLMEAPDFRFRGTAPEPNTKGSRNLRRNG